MIQTMKTIKLELSVKLLLGAIALGLFLNAYNDFVPGAYAEDQRSKSSIRRIIEDCRIQGYAEDSGYFNTYPDC